MTFSSIKRIGILVLLAGMLCCAWSATTVYHAADAGESPDTLAIWIVFSDKNGQAKKKVSARAQKRRSRKGYRSGEDRSDFLIPPHYITEVENTGAILRNCFLWENAASFDVPLNQLHLLYEMPFIDGIYTVGMYINKTTSSLKKNSAFTVSKNNRYGTLEQSLSLIQVPAAHYYISEKYPDKIPGEGVRIAFFDSGFRLGHRCFNHLFDRDAIVGCYDFVDGDTTVDDPDSVMNDAAHPLRFNDQHGSEVLSLVAGYDPPFYCGAAWGSEFLLARTEQGDHELHTEEDNWAAAVVWAESLGVDIISSSLGYRTDFEDTAIIERETGIYDTITDYRKRDLDGKTTIVSLAARHAVERGVLIVNAAGNELDEWGDTSISAPADVDGVITVGSVSDRKELSPFSSVGPTSDGRIKPDVLAHGQGVALPWVYAVNDTAYDNYGNGTSYATPLIAGSMALIKQCWPELSGEQLREQIYRFCAVPRNRTYPSGYYGKGIPDIAYSCLRNNNEVLIFASDEMDKPMADVVISDEHNRRFGTTNDDGYTLFSIEQTEPDSLYVTINERERAFHPEVFPLFKKIHPCSLIVTFHDQARRTLIFTAVKIDYLDSINIAETDEYGRVHIVDYLPSATLFTFSSSGYASDTLQCSFVDRTAVMREMQFSIVSEKPVLVYPTLLRRRSGDHLTIKCFNKSENDEAAILDVSIRSLTGTLVWHQAIDISNSFPELQWNARTRHGNALAPGTYFVLVSLNNTVYREKILIAE